MTGGGCRWAAKPRFQENSRTEQHLHWTTAQSASCCSAGLGTLFWTLVRAGGSVPDLGWVPGPLCILLSRLLAVLLHCPGQACGHGYTRGWCHPVSREPSTRCSPPMELRDTPQLRRYRRGFLSLLGPVSAPPWDTPISAQAPK